MNGKKAKAQRRAVRSKTVRRQLCKQDKTARLSQDSPDRTPPVIGIYNAPKHARTRIALFPRMKDVIGKLWLDMSSTENPPQRLFERMDRLIKLKRIAGTLPRPELQRRIAIA
jgi:hypothetical protein